MVRLADSYGNQLPPVNFFIGIPVYSNGFASLTPKKGSKWSLLRVQIYQQNVAFLSYSQAAAQ